jgi:2-oxoglutarate ferredoxin oxidoreductase subunit gamma
MNDSETRIVIAGFGGQGVVLMGNVIARAAMIDGRNVTLMVSYGAEMRGGTANATVVLSEGPIASPYIETLDIAIVLNRPSLDRFEPVMAPDGHVIVNRSLIDRNIERDDLTVTWVEATSIAQKLGNVRATNMVAMGAFAGATKLIGAEALAEAVRLAFQEKSAKLVELNTQALQAGLDAVTS